MFTGLVETLGRVVATVEKPPGRTLRIEVGPELRKGLAIGDSISINGCCLTVVVIEIDGVDFEAGEETLSRTNLGRLQPGHHVNLERSVAVGDRMGGHYVTGHVDALSQVLAIEPDPPWAKYWFSVPAPLARQVASKGSVTLDGVSLTVVDALVDRFSVALIPHTLSVTTLGSRAVGDSVNLETDVLAKYIERQLGERLSWPNDKPAAS
jgi:riboflavin synthase